MLGLVWVIRAGLGMFGGGFLPESSAGFGGVGMRVIELVLPVFVSFPFCQNAWP